MSFDFLNNWLDRALNSCTDVEIVFIVVFGICSFILAIYSLYLMKLSGYKPDVKFDTLPPISVVVPVHNQLKRLKNTIHLLLAQNYPLYEIVVVLDHCDDGTEEYLREIQKMYHFVRYTKINNKTDFSRSLSLTLGIRASAYEWMLFLEPGVELISSTYLRDIAPYLIHKEVVLGYVSPYSRSTFWGKLINLESFISFCLHSSAHYIGAAMPTFGFNIAYRKSLFMQLKGFAPNLKSRFAENELLANKMSVTYGSRLSMDTLTIIQVDEFASKNTWIDYKETQAELRKKFTLKQRIFLFLYTYALLTEIITFYTLLIISGYRWYVLCFGIMGMLWRSLWILKLQKRLFEPNIFFMELLYHYCLPLINLWFWLKSIFIRK